MKKFNKKNFPPIVDNILHQVKLTSSEKGEILNSSKGLVFPVLWHEPFGLAIIESLYYGCPVLVLLMDHCLR